jgi:hypothetical protein
LLNRSLSDGLRQVALPRSAGAEKQREGLGLFTHLITGLGFPHPPREIAERFRPPKTAIPHLELAPSGYARVGAVIQMKVEDYYIQNRRADG